LVLFCHVKAIENCPPKVPAGKNIRGRGITLPAGEERDQSIVNKSRKAGNEVKR